MKCYSEQIHKTDKTRIGFSSLTPISDLQSTLWLHQQHQKLHFESIRRPIQQLVSNKPSHI